MINVRAVIERELRVEARHGLNYWLRSFTGLVGVGLIGLFLIDVGGSGALTGRGGKAFSYLHATLFSLIWILVPVLTCDCISRERREGTLGLLLLTPLKPQAVALAKGFSSGLKSFSVILAVLPVMMIPVLLGGVLGMDLARGALMDLMALIGSTTAGVAASSLCVRHNRAMVLSLIFSGGLLWVFGNILTVYFAWNSNPGFPLSDNLVEWLMVITVGAWLFPANGAEIWQDSDFASTPAVMGLSAGLVVLAGVVLGLVLWWIGRRIRRLACDQPRTRRQQWWWQTFCAPRFLQRMYRWRMRRQLERNPMGWLAVRTWSARLTKYGVVAGVGLYEIVVLGYNSIYELAPAQIILALILASLIALSAAGSFRRERETRVLELLLVTPLSIPQIIFGRLRAVWGQFLAALILLVFCWYLGMIGLRQDFFRREVFWVFLILTACFISCWLVLPIVGAHQSLVRRHFFVAWLNTLLLGAVIPIAGTFFTGVAIIVALHDWAREVWQSLHLNEMDLLFLWIVAGFCLQLLFAIRALVHLTHRLRRRTFVPSE